MTTIVLASLLLIAHIIAHPQSHVPQSDVVHVRGKRRDNSED